MAGLIYEGMFDGWNDVVLLENGQPTAIGGNGAAADSSGNLADSIIDGGEPVLSLGGNIYFNGSDDLMVFANNAHLATNTAQDISAGNASAYSAGVDPQDLVGYNNSVYFVGLGSHGAKRLWVTNGTAAGTEIVPDSPIDNGQMASYQGSLYYNGSNGALEAFNSANSSNAQHGFSTVGSADINPQDMIAASYSALFGGSGTDLFMNGTDSGGDKDLYVYNGSSLTRLGAKGLNPQDLTAVTTDIPIAGLTFDYSAVYFSGVDPTTGQRGLFEADPGASAVGSGKPPYVTEIAKPSLGGSSFGLDPQDITALNGEIYFAGGDDHNALDPHAEGLWVYNPATPNAAPTEVVSSANYDLDLNASVLGTLAHPQPQIAASGGEIYFSAVQNNVQSLFVFNPAAHTTPVSAVSGANGANAFNLLGV